MHLYDLNELLNAKSSLYKSPQFSTTPPTTPPAICIWGKYGKNLPQTMLNDVGHCRLLRPNTEHFLELHYSLISTCQHYHITKKKNKHFPHNLDND